jgi:hypothetical protein
VTAPASTDGLSSRSTGASTTIPVVRCAILVAGAFGIVLAGVESPLFDLDRYAVPKELVLHLIALLSALTLLRGWRRFEPGVIDLLLLSYLAWSAFSALLAQNHWLALRGFGVSLSGAAIWFSARAVARDGLRPALLSGTAAAAVLAALLGAVQAYGFDIPWLATERPPGATFGNRNFLAHLLVITLPTVLIGGLRVRRRVWFVFAMAALLLVSGTIILTRSRAAWLALATQIGMLGLASFVLLRGMLHDRVHGYGAMRAGRTGRIASAIPDISSTVQRRMAVAALAVAAGATLAVLVPNSLQWRSDSPYTETLSRLADYREGSGRGRLIQYRNTLDLVRADPLLGVGPGNWLVAYPRVTTPGDPSYAGSEPIPTNPWPSSDWLAFLSERGIVGSVLLLFAGIACVLTAVRRILQLRPVPAALDGALALATIVAAAVTGLFDAVLLLAAPTLFFWGILGATLPATAPVRIWVPSLKQRSVTTAGTVMAFAMLTLVAAGGVAAIVIAGDGRDRDAVERALRYDPGNHRLHLLLSGRGACRLRVPHARAARNLLPEHPAPLQALRACGISTESGE